MSDFIDKKEKRAAVAAEEAKKSRKFRTYTIIAVAVIVVLVAAAAVINSNYFYTRVEAVKVGDTSYNAAELTFFFKGTFNNIYTSYYNQFGDAISYIVDAQSPLDEQPYSETQTWADYVLEETLSNMANVTALYDAAMAEGYTLTAEQQQQIDESIASFQLYADAGSYPNIDGFLSAYYCKGMTSKLLSKLLEKTVIADAYSTDLAARLTYTEDELTAYYDEHADEYDFYDYYSYAVAQSSAAFDGVAEEEKAAKAHEAAETIAAAGDEDTFKTLVAAFAGEGTNVMMSHYNLASINELYSDWVTSDDRKAGDTTVVDGEDTSYVLYYVGKDCNDYNVVNFRHILINAVADENGNYTDEALETAKNRAEAIYSTWQLDPTEEQFVLLANDNSEDAGSNTNGGYYGNVAKYNMVTEINDFLFDPNTKEGDTTVVYGSNGAYAGYHVVYRCADGDLYRDYIAESEMRQNDYDEKVEALMADYPVTEAKGEKYANLT